MEDKIKYYLDETDQIEVDGHTLSRLYLAEHHTHALTVRHNMLFLVKIIPVGKWVDILRV